MIRKKLVEEDNLIAVFYINLNSSLYFTKKKCVYGLISNREEEKKKNWKESIIVEKKINFWKSILVKRRRWTYTPYTLSFLVDPLTIINTYSSF